MTAINRVADLELEGEIAVLTLDAPPVNALSLELREGLQQGIERAIADASAKAIVLICAGRTFIAGADIREFGKPRQKPDIFDNEDAIEGSPKPVIAAIHGTALGGGLEIALSCHYRIAVPSARCGLPEVNIGIVPGAGGTQRLTRIVGPEKALDLVTSGQHIEAPACLQLGLIDELAPEGGLRRAAIELARRVLAENRPLRKVRDRNEKVEAARAHPEIFAEFRRANARRFRGFLAPEANIRCIEAAVNLPFDEGLQVERTENATLIRGPQATAQRYVFFAERSVWKIPDVPDDTPQIPVGSVGIIGAGTMGGGIAMNFANAGIPVRIVERQQDALDRGLAVIRRNYENSAKRGRISMSDVEQRMNLIRGSLALAELSSCDLVIEAVFENMRIKKELFAALDGIAKQEAILATNTSALNIDEIATAVKRPEAVIGMHFFSPANVMRLVEVVRADKTSRPVIATTMQLARRLGKIGVLVGVCPGFVGNRILYARQAQVQQLLMEGAMPWEIDRVIYEFGLPMGPFQMADLAGLDIGWSRETSKGQSLRDVLCEMDRRGQKTSAGYYDYDANRNATPSPVVEQLVREFAARRGGTPRTIPEQEILDRCIAPMINEGAKILEEGKAIRASDIDMVWCNGYGWPTYRGGPMFHADAIGLDRVLGVLRELEKNFGPAYQPSALLERVAAEGKRLHEV